MMKLSSSARTSATSIEWLRQPFARHPTSRRVAVDVETIVSIRRVATASLTRNEPPYEPAGAVGILLDGIEPFLVDVGLIRFEARIAELLEQNGLVVVAANFAELAYRSIIGMGREIFVLRISVPRSEIDRRNRQVRKLVGEVRMT